MVVKVLMERVNSGKAGGIMTVCPLCSPVPVTGLNRKWTGWRLLPDPSPRLGQHQAGLRVGGGRRSVYEKETVLSRLRVHHKNARNRDPGR